MQIKVSEEILIFRKQSERALLWDTHTHTCDNPIYTTFMSLLLGKYCKYCVDEVDEVSEARVYNDGTIGSFFLLTATSMQGASDTLYPPHNTRML